MSLIKCAAEERKRRKLGFTEPLLAIGAGSGYVYGKKTGNKLALKVSDLTNAAKASRIGRIADFFTSKKKLLAREKSIRDLQNKLVKKSKVAGTVGGLMLGALSGTTLDMITGR